MNATTFFNTATTVLSFAVLAAAIAPAQAEAKSASATIERSIAATLRLPAAVSKAGIATVAVRLGTNGSVESANLIESTGVAAYDREALRTANAVSYPAGSARNIVMVLGFDRPVTASDRAKSVTLATQYRTDRRQLLATETTATPNG